MSDPRPTYPENTPSAPGGAGPAMPPSGQPGDTQAAVYGHAAEAHEHGEKPKHPVSFGQILGGVLLVLVVVFIVENSKSVDIRLIGPVVHAPLYVAILIATVLGALIAALLRYRRVRGARRKQQARQYRAEQKHR